MDALEVGGDKAKDVVDFFFSRVEKATRGMLVQVQKAVVCMAEVVWQNGSVAQIG